MNWKRLWITIKRDLLQYRYLLLLCVGFAVLGIALVLINNFSPFADPNFIIGVSAGTSVFAIMMVGQLTAIFNSKGSAITLMMVPASNLEKFISKILVLAVIPVMVILGLHAASRSEVGTLFATQIGVEKTAENFERFHPEDIECTNLFTSASYTYRNDSVTISYHGRFSDVVLNQYPNDWIQVGISSSHFGDLMMIIGLLGFMIYGSFGFRNRHIGNTFGVLLAALPLIICATTIDKVFYKFMSISAVENYLLIVSIITGIIGMLLIWRAYKAFCRKTVDIEDNNDNIAVGGTKINPLTIGHTARGRNDIFDINRYWNYQKHVVKETRLVLAIILGIFWLSMILGKTIDSMREVPVFVAIMLTLFMPIAAFWPNYAKKKSIADMMIPASTLEKYVSRLLVFWILPLTALLLMKHGFEKDISVFILISAIFWIIGVVFKKFGFSISGCTGILIRPLNALQEHIGESFYQLVIISIIASIIGGYAIYKRQNVTLTNWKQQ